MDMSAEDAARVKAPGWDTIRNTHVLYLPVGDLNHLGGLMILCHEAYKSFVRATCVSIRHQLKAERDAWQAFLDAGKQLGDPGMPRTGYGLAMLDSYTLDNLLVAAGLELSLKAILVEKGYVVHRISEKDPAYTQLAKRQKEEPVSVTDIKAISDFRCNGIKYLPGITESSINFSWMTQKSAYRQALGLGDNILNFIEECREVRNQIHLPGDHKERSIANSFGKPIGEVIVDFANRELVDRVDLILAAHPGIGPGRLVRLN